MIRIREYAPTVSNLELCLVDGSRHPIDHPTRILICPRYPSAQRSATYKASSLETRVSICPTVATSFPTTVSVRPTRYPSKATDSPRSRSPPDRTARGIRRRARSADPPETMPVRTPSEEIPHSPRHPPAGTTVNGAVPVVPTTSPVSYCGIGIRETEVDRLRPIASAGTTSSSSALNETKGSTSPSIPFSAIQRSPVAGSNAIALVLRIPLATATGLLEDNRLTIVMHRCQIDRRISELVLDQPTQLDQAGTPPVVAIGTDVEDQIPCARIVRVLAVTSP